MQAQGALAMFPGHMEETGDPPVHMSLGPAASKGAPPGSLMLGREQPPVPVADAHEYMGGGGQEEGIVCPGDETEHKVRGHAGAVDLGAGVHRVRCWDWQQPHQQIWVC